MYAHLCNQCRPSTQTVAIVCRRTNMHVKYGLNFKKTFFFLLLTLMNGINLFYKQCNLLEVDY